MRKALAGPHGGGGHHHGGGGGFINPMFWGGWGYPAPTTEVVDDEPRAANCPAGYVAMRTASGNWVCVPQAAAAKARPALSGLADDIKSNAAFLAVLALGGYLLYKHAKRSR